MDDVSFELRPGTVTALVGESGSGKSTVARILARLIEPSGGNILFEGSDFSRCSGRHDDLYYRSQVQIIFQDPFGSLNPVKTVRHHIARPLRIHDVVPRDRVDERVHELLAGVGLVPPEEIAAKYPHELSGGQRQRVAIARALAVEPKVVLADEPTSMLDVSIRIGILNLMTQLKEEHQIAFLYVTHDLSGARYVADDILVMYAGQIVEQGPVEEVLANPLHPYTRLLLTAAPDSGEALHAEQIEQRGSGTASAAIAPPEGCRFVARCPLAIDVCSHVTPQLVEARPRARRPLSRHRPVHHLNERNAMATDRTIFPDDFRWGAATASYQIEGAAHEDGRGESVWDRFAATPGKVRNGDTGEIACDFYHRYREDIALMKELGLDAFRFSIAWPRVLPEGRGRVNPLGLDFYDRLVDALLENEIEPFATLFHWDTPQALEDAGGWPARETAEAFVEYTEAVVERLGDRVRHWMTHNEPWVCAWIGHAWGEHAPGRKSEADAVAAAHHLLLSHGWAVQAIRRASPDAQVGIIAQSRARVSRIGLARGRGGGVADRRRGQPLVPRPASSAARTRPTCSTVSRSSSRSSATATSRRSSAPIDFLGVNNYFRFVVGAGAEGPRLVSDPKRCAPTWAGRSTPTGCTRLLTRVAEDYAPPAIYVTENGAAFGDVRGHDGRVHDPERTAYLAGAHRGGRARGRRRRAR